MQPAQMARRERKETRATKEIRGGKEFKESRVRLGLQALLVRMVGKVIKEIRE